ncbi:NUDIX domain-containing protein [Streptomyces sp. NBC_01525]|uniref:NUDIX domain-containing protein n=1 Tax=Streptomyces sp. NBC_01525 TaxID=2903893 RepID=UPI00386B47F7
MTLPRIRVAAGVVRHRVVPELVAFDHVGMAEAGTQAPAGGVEAGEAPERAVLREVAEETGLSGATVVRRITVEDEPHPDTAQPRRTTFFLLRAPDGAPDAWEHRVRGDGDDAGPACACHFLPLPLHRPLADDQDIWLGHVAPRWATARPVSDRMPPARDA